MQHAPLSINEMATLKVRLLFNWQLVWTKFKDFGLTFFQISELIKSFLAKFRFFIYNI